MNYELMGAGGYGSMVDISSYTTIYGVMNTFNGGKYSDGLDHIDYRSKAEGIMTVGARRLNQYKWIPVNNLEFSRTLINKKKQGFPFYNNIFSFTGEYFQIEYPQTSGDSIADYFMTLQTLSATPTEIRHYLRLLAWWELSGVSINEIYVDEAFPDLKSGLGAYRYRGFARKQEFLENYENAIRDLGNKFRTMLLNTATLTQKASKQFNKDTAISYLKELQSNIATGFQKAGGASGSNLVEKSKNYIEGLMNTPYPVELIQRGYRNPGYDKLYGSSTVIANNPAFIPRNIYQVPIYVVASDEKGKPVSVHISDMIKAQWEISITPLLAQIDWLAAKIARLDEDPSTLSQDEINSLNNLDDNLFLALDLPSTEALKQIVVRQKAVAPIIKNQASRIALPKMQYMYNAVLKVPVIKAMNAPKWNIIVDTSKKPPPPAGANNGSIPWGLILGAGAAAAAIYYSSR